MHTTKNGRNIVKEPTICTTFMGEWSQQIKPIHVFLCSYLNKQLAKEKLDAESQHTFMTDDTEGPFPHMSIGDVQTIFNLKNLYCSVGFCNLEK